MRDKKILYLIDGHGLIFKAYFAMIRNPLFSSKGLNTSAVFGFTNMLFKLLKDEKPEFLAVAFDVKGKTFRHKLFDEYKANRPPTPPDLIKQEPFIRQILDAMKIPIFEKVGFEADDVIATIAKKAVEKGFYVRIVSKDKDIHQLISKEIVVLSPEKGVSELKTMNENEVIEKFGVKAEQIVDYLSLLGDNSDNIPGVPSVGKKTAAALLYEFGTLENIVNNLSDIKRKKLRETILFNKVNVFKSKKLIILDSNVPIEFDFDDMKVSPPDDFNKKDLIKVFKELEFKEFQRQITPKINPENLNYVCIQTKEKLSELLVKLKKAKRFCFDVETDGLNPFKANLVGISFAVASYEAFYIPLGHRLNEEQLLKSDVLKLLQPIFNDGTIHKFGHNVKFDWEVLQQNGIIINGITDDTMIASALIKPDRRKNNLNELTFEYLGETKTPTEALIGKGAKAITMDLLPVKMVCNYACEDADTTFRLRDVFEKILAEYDLENNYQNIEIPLIPVILKMEKIGFKIDITFLKNLETHFNKLLKTLKQEIFSEANEEFNINSPKQLSHILFDKLKYPVKGIKKTTLGHSTNEKSLQKLIKADFMYKQLPQLILEFRSLTKLLNTYVVALLKIADEKTHRVHTSYNQSVTETGRLSSSDPNLQNIPIRTELGREIRKAFIAENSDWVILSADYSQVELRILAHISQDKRMMDAFKNGQDIHAHTASEIFNVPIAQVTSQQRRMAKTINFGIDYGMTEWGLSSRLAIPVNKARTYINTYLNRYSGIKNYVADTILFAQKYGFVKTLFNRRRFIPEINAKSRNIREASERQAINMPIQGSAAEMIKIAMIEIDEILSNKKLNARMLLQVHDELVFEVPKNELEIVKNIVKDKMENAVSLTIPVVVDISWGNSWAEAH